MSQGPRAQSDTFTTFSILPACPWASGLQFLAVDLHSPECFLDLFISGSRETGCECIRGSTDYPESDLNTAAAAAAAAARFPALAVSPVRLVFSRYESSAD